MPNQKPIFPRVGDTSANASTTLSTTMTTATGDFTWASANHVLVHTADATSGSIVYGIIFKAIGTNTASVARIYQNNGSSNGTAANNGFIGELSLPATTSTNTAAVAWDFVWKPPVPIVLPPSFRIYVGLWTTVAAGWVATCIAWKF
jgi:hypothetical protein